MQISAQIGAIVGGSLRGMNLEIFSPYFDDGPACKPLHAFIAAFSPAQVRIHLPLNDRAEALCDAATFEAVAAMVGVRWGTLPRDFLRLGASEDAGGRSVHAKVYRFFEPLRGGREVLYVGSANLTSAGCGGGNLESGFLVETTGKGKPDWWLAVSTVAPTSFGCEHEDEGAAKTCATLLALRYFWNSGTAEAKWTGVNVSPTLVISQGGITAFTLAAIEPGEWRTLAPADAERLAEVLVQSSLLSVDGESDEPRFLLVQEEGMSHRPSILLDLSAADILRYWSLLSVAQRAAFIEARSRVAGDDDPLVTALQPIAVMDTMFDRLAGIFHAFECLRESVLKALGEKQYRDADYRLFGRKYDSLPTLLEQVLADHRHGRGETVEHYVVAMSARQLFDEIKWADAEYWKTHHADVQAIQQQLSELKDLRQALAAGKPEMPAFLDWFDHWFLRRAEPLSPEAT